MIETLEQLAAAVSQRAKHGLPPTAQQIALIRQHAAELFGGDSPAQDWLESPTRALNFRTPAACLQSQDDAARVVDLLGAIRCGVNV